MPALVELVELAVGQSTQLSTPEGRWFTGQGKSAATIAAAGQNDFVYQPAGVAHDNVYTSWPLLVAAVNAVSGVRRILIDAWILDPASGHAPVPAGTWDLSNVELYGNQSSDGFAPFLVFQAGAVVRTNSLSAFEIGLSSVSTAPVIVFAGGLGGTIQLSLSEIIASAAAPFIHVAADDAAASVNIVALNGSAIGDATNPVIDVAGGVTIGVLLNDQSILFANATSGAGGVSLSFTPGSNVPDDNADAFVQVPQLAGLLPNNLVPTFPFPRSEQFLANLLAPAEVVGVGAVQTANANTATIPHAGLGDVAAPMPNNASGHVELKLLARIPSTGQTVMWHAEAPFKKTGGVISVGTLLNVGGNALSLFGATAGDAAAFAGAIIAIAIVAANVGIVPQVTGINGLVIDWTAQATYFYTHA